MREKNIYIAHKINREIEIDENGFKDEIWKLAEPMTWYKAGSTDTPTSITESGILWSDTHIYLNYKAYDKDIFSYNIERNSHTYLEDVLEFFFKTDLNNTAYYNFEINALNTVYDAYQPKQNFAGGDHRWSKWDCKNLKSAVFVKGKINNPEIIDEYWKLQVAIPFEEIEINGKSKPDFNDKWEFMMSRYDYSIHIPSTGVELSATTIFNKPEFSFHDSKYWNYLVFAE